MNRCLVSILFLIPERNDVYNISDAFVYVASAAVKYLESNPPPVDAKKFDAACGVGERI